jgi:protein TonB
MQIVLGGIGFLIIAGGLIAYFSKSRPVAPTPIAEDQATDAEAIAQVALPTVETSIVKGKVDELLEKARLAMRERRYTEPAGDNALLYYRSAAATDASSAEALDGLNRIATVLTGRIDDAFESGQLEDAATALAQFKNASPDDPRVATYQQRLTGTQISKAMADGNLDRAAALVRAAQQNSLLPAPQISRWRSEITRLQGEAREKRAAELAAREAAAAEQKKLREARAAAAAEAERQAQAERDRQRDEQLKVEQAAQVARTDAAPSEPATAKTATTLQSSLKRRRYVAPEYPMDALARRVGGVVQVAFVVDVKGEPRNIEVVAADPKGIFDRAAVAAVKRWRYEPVVVDGAPAEVPVRMQIRFAPDQ